MQYLRSNYKNRLEFPFKLLFNDVQLKTRRALSLCKVYGDSALLGLNGTLLHSINASRRHVLLLFFIPALMIFKDVLLRTRRALSLCKVYGDSALVGLNGTLLYSINTSRRLCASSFFYTSINDIQRCSVENQKGTIAVQSLWR